MVNKYYFSIENDEQRQKLLRSLHKLKTSPAWKMIRRHYEKVKEDAEESIFSVEGNHDPEFNREDLLKRERALIKEFIEAPEDFIRLCEPEALPDLGKSLDPYDKSLLNRGGTSPASPEDIDGVSL